MIKLNRIIIRNFKIFGEEPYIINFGKSELILLDGPNGYGKTSVFDAIELALTGNLSRLIALDNRQNPTDIVVAHKNSENVEIIIELIDNQSNLKVFKRKLKSKIPNSARKISKFSELWELFEVNGDNCTLIESDFLENYFHSKNFSRDFLLFHYVQQEETSHFLKSNNETQRAEELAQLFGNINSSYEKLNKIYEINKKIINSQKNVLEKISYLENHYKVSSINDQALKNIEPHFHLFPWLAKTPKAVFWDKTNIDNFNQDKLNIFLNEINLIKDFLVNKNTFFRIRAFHNVTLQTELLQYYLGYFNFIDKVEEINEESNYYHLISNAYKILREGDFKKIKSILDLDFILGKFIPDHTILFKAELESLLEKEEKLKGLSSIHSEIIKYRDSMTSALQSLPEENNCILCGTSFQKHDELLHAITKHGHYLHSELSTQDKLIIQARDSFNLNYLKPLLSKCNEYLEKNFKPSQEDLNYLSKAVQMKDRLFKLKNWLVLNNIEYSDLTSKEYPIDNKDYFFHQAVEKICDRIKSAIGKIPDEYYEKNQESSFERIYLDYFNNDPKNLELINQELLELKENYIKNLYFNSLQDVLNEHSRLNKINNIYKSSIEDIANITRIIKKKIRQYQKKLITDIEIPFYIYSGKILQTHQAGLGQGIFIKDPTGEDQLKNVRLVSNWKSDHDILNTMSSGQISAVVIALTLALHRVYSTRFSCILIDDPVQTMDDINMSSLVELLRNDFSDKQVVLSTHEDKVARYFTYKYLKYNKNVKIVNIMQKKEYSPQNRYINYSNNI
ncbi:AAA family ATPase [Acinetobacter baumannii]|uniref:AAA family ATPase n=1 Tax=Acinetobacter baumannii TaxID=470 RepID=UPI00366EFE92